MTGPADIPTPPARSRWHDWWKLPVFFAGLAAVIAVLRFLGPEWLILLLVAYLLVRSVGGLFRKGGKR